MVLTNVFGIYATIRATAAALRATQGPPRDHVEHRRPPGAQGLALLARPSSPSPGMAEAARQDFNGTGVRTTLISPGMVETRGLQPRPRRRR